ncbi:hypothetical protein PF008_g32328, partial [Phytophthora fragariae]
VQTLLTRAWPPLQTHAPFTKVEVDGRVQAPLTIERPPEHVHMPSTTLEPAGHVEQTPSMNPSDPEHRHTALSSEPVSVDVDGQVQTLLTRAWPPLQTHAPFTKVEVDGHVQAPLTIERPPEHVHMPSTTLEPAGHVEQTPSMNPSDPEHRHTALSSEPVSVDVDGQVQTLLTRAWPPLQTHAPFTKVEVYGHVQAPLTIERPPEHVHMPSTTLEPAGHVEQTPSMNPSDPEHRHTALIPVPVSVDVDGQVQTLLTRAWPPLQTHAPFTKVEVDGHVQAPLTIERPPEHVHMPSTTLEPAGHVEQTPSMNPSDPEHRH